MIYTMCANTSAMTQSAGYELGLVAFPGMTVLIEGPLGAGKTTFVQGLACGVGALEPVTSPTFALVHEYRTGRIPLIHADMYRLSGPDDAADLGLEEYMDSGCVLVVEWPDRVEELVPDDRIVVSITSSPDSDQRAISVMAHGASHDAAAKGAYGC